MFRGFHKVITSIEEQKQIELVQTAILKKKAKWTAGKTSISQLSHEELKQLCGVLIEPIPEELRRKPAVHVAVPSKFDWRNKDGQDWTTTIKNQIRYGIINCGSCWAFGTLAALEAQYNIQTGIPNINRDLSEQYMLSCSEGSCDGWGISDTLDWLKTKWKEEDTGTPDEDCFSYQADDTIPCENACADHLNRLYHLKEWHWVPKNREDIKNYILVAPVPAMMQVYTDFKFYLGGIYEHSWGDLASYHEVTIVGWDDANECWICKNCWGSILWGEDGWFRIKYGECEIENAVTQYDRVGKGFGDINCTTNPSGAYIYLNDTPTGHYTPYKFSGIAAYSYRIKFQLAGYADCYRTISLKDGEYANVRCDMTPIITPTPTSTPTPTATPTPTPTATPTATPFPTPRFRFDAPATIFYDGKFYNLGETIYAYAGDDLIAHASIKEVNGTSGTCIFNIDNYTTGEHLCRNWKDFRGYDKQSIICGFDMLAESMFVIFSACYGDEETDQAGWIYLSLQTLTPTPTPTATATPTATPTVPPPVLGECILPRVFTGTPTPRMEKSIPFYRVKCLYDKWG